MDQVTVSPMNFHGVKTGSFGPEGSGREIGDGRLNFLRAHLFGNGASRRSGDGRRSQGRKSGNPGVSEPSGVMQLQSHGPTLAVDRLSQAPEAGQKGIVVGTDPTGAMTSGEAHGAGFGNDQTGSPVSPGGIVGNGPIADRPIRMRKIISHGRHEDAVLQPKIPDRKRREERFKTGHGLFPAKFWI
jgi:hypothetical protein